MADTRQRSAAADRALWVIAFAMVTIAVCLVVLVTRSVPQAQTPSPAPPVPLANAAVADEPATMARRPFLPVAPRAAAKHAAMEEIPQPAAEPSVVYVEALAAPPAERTFVEVPAGGFVPQNAAGKGAPILNAGTISGTVRFSGIPPPEKVIRTADADATCGPLHAKPLMTHNYRVAPNGGLADVFVYVRSGLEGRAFSPASAPVVVDQRGCEFQPYVFGVMTNQPVIFTNSDPVMHSVHATRASANAGPEFSLTEPPHKGVSKSFADGGLVRIGCDFHPWMHTYAFVGYDPYFAVTDRSGRFTITNVPPGSYVVEACHLATLQDRRSGLDLNVVVESNATAEVNFTIDAPLARR